MWGFQTQRSVQTHHYKYCYDPCDIDELYDRQNDPWEKKNLIDAPAYADIVKEMKARLLGWNDFSNDHIQWSWPRWNFPKPVPPNEINHNTMPLTGE